MFLLDRLFREKAVERMGRRDPLDRMLRVTAPHEWMLLAGSGIVLLGFAVWGVVGSMELDVRSADCVLARPGERHAVVAPHAGVVVEVLAAAGDRVAEGQTLARISSPALRGTEADEADDRIVSPRAGEVMALDVTPGRLVAALEPVGLVRDGADDHLQALTFMPPERAQQVATGMTAQIRVTEPGSRRVQVLAAEVREVSERPVPLPHWLQDVGQPAAGPAHRVLAALSPAPGADAGVTDGAGCEARVVLGSQAPIRLLLAGAGG